MMAVKQRQKQQQRYNFQELFLGVTFVKRVKKEYMNKY